MGATNSRPALNLKAAYDRVKSILTGVRSDIDILDLIAKHNAGNGIYNGKMTISQRGDYTSAVAATDAEYYLDRWKSRLVTIAGTIQDTGESLKMVATSSATGQIGAYQSIERFDDYSNKTITFSVKVKSNHADARIAILASGVWAGNSSSHSGSGEWELLTLTLPFSAITTSLVMYVRIVSSSNTSVSITSGDYIEFTDVRLDLGEHRLSGDREYGEELALCQRYYERIGSDGLRTFFSEGGVSLTSTVFNGAITFKEKRAVPTITAPTAASAFSLNVAGTRSSAAGGFSASLITRCSFSMSITMTSADTSGYSGRCSIRTDIDPSYFIGISAEL